MALVNISSPHTTRGSGAGSVMLHVILATIPGFLALTWQFGGGVAINVILAGLTALASEALVLRLRGRPVMFYLRDLSALLTGILLGLALPPFVPWWVTITGTAFAVIVAKQLYGGLGYNLFNPAMVGYVVLLISFPVQMTAWLPPEGLGRSAELGLGDAFSAIFTGQVLSGETVDAFTMATPLDTLRIYAESLTEEELFALPVFGEFAGRGWWIVNLGFLAGGIYLWQRGYITWHTPAGLIGALAVLSLLFHANDADRFASPLVHLFGGATMLGAFFIATDPVSCATSNRGRLLFGIGVGVITFVIRTWGSYPDAIAFGVLLMNLAAPLLDHYTIPRTYGHVRKKREVEAEAAPQAQASTESGGSGA